ncbi:MAG: hypothetical protein HY749_15920 [Gammaproteobacteria bacterium]|nr:hypothetical protein [Gammaproteobacteria bacterium]
MSAGRKPASAKAAPAKPSRRREKDPDIIEYEVATNALEKAPPLFSDEQVMALDRVFLCEGTSRRVGLATGTLSGPDLRKALETADPRTASMMIASIRLWQGRFKDMHEVFDALHARSLIATCYRNDCTDVLGEADRMVREGFPAE